MVTTVATALNFIQRLKLHVYITCIRAVLGYSWAVLDPVQVILGNEIENTEERGGKVSLEMVPMTREL